MKDLKIQNKAQITKNLCVCMTTQQLDTDSKGSMQFVQVLPQCTHTKYIVVTWCKHGNKSFAYFKHPKWLPRSLYSQHSSPTDLP